MRPTSETYLERLMRDDSCSLYEFQPPDGTQHGVVQYVASTPQSRLICNDPLVLGLQYTQSLSVACAACLKSLHAAGHIQCSERSTSVLHILRGGLNFGLREALGGAFAWNAHGASFLSAQRERLPESPTEWRIVEDSYQKVYLEEVQTVVFGDVVATGTSLEHALQALLEHVVDQKAPLREIVFFTIGGNRSTTLLKEYGEKFRSAVGSFESCSVIYLEGIFAVPDTTTPLRIKIDGTDLLRRDSILAPEFVESQYEKPQYALERCTIYDAGSRAFHIPEYLEDLREYWEAIAQHAASGVGYAELVEERMPELDLERLGRHDLYEIAQLQLARITQNS